MGWFVVTLVIASAFIGKLIGDRVGFPVFFTFLGTLVGATISGLGIKIAIRNVRNMDKK
jgi:ABC-type molybdate transport system permease subunit